MKALNSVKERLSTAENVLFIKDWLAANTNGTRNGLAKELCERLGLRDGKGAWQKSSAVKALRDLEAEGRWKLPAALPRGGGGKWTPRKLGYAVSEPNGVPQKSEELEGLELIEVKAEDGERVRIWNELILREHPLRDCRLVGRQLRYLIASPHGWLGAIGFGSSALYLQSRDEWIGWNDSQRAQHQQRVINMTRYLIRPSVRCENLASHVLGLCSRRVARDYEARYGIEPWLMETFVDRDQYAGTCFQAANWLCVGQTLGRGRNGSKKEGKSIKDVYLYPLRSDLRAQMGVRPKEIEPLSLETGLDADQWAEQEFGGCELGDVRLTAQLVKVAQDKGRQPSGSYARACGGDRYQLKNYYRLINKERDQLSPASLLQGHREQTIRRLANEKVALVVQDTMDINFATRAHCENLGQIGTNQKHCNVKGLKMHSSLALNTRGIPLGVLRVDQWAPEPADKNTHRNNLPIEEKDSYRWIETYLDIVNLSSRLPNTSLVCIGDRESDIFELFNERRRQGGHVEILVRVQHNRCLEGEEAKLFECLRQGPAAEEISINVPRQREKLGKPSKPGQPAMPARTARVEIRFREVTLSSPKTPQLRDKQPLTMFAVSLIEKNPPPETAPIQWLLLTTIEVRSIKVAKRCVRWYCLRWRIEEWHRVLKSGCRIQEHQNHSAKVLTRTITLDAVIAWRIMLLALLGRELPNMPCDLLFNSWECSALQLLAQKKSP
jgi:hypothetical protein